LLEQNDQDDDQKDQSANTDVHYSLLNSVPAIEPFQEAAVPTVSAA
jgi:hypothetical protein